jgi:hypothetical protein
LLNSAAHASAPRFGLENISVFGSFKRKPDSPAAGQVAHQPPGEVFPWPKGCQLTALDEVILAVPVAILTDSEDIGSVIHCGDDVRLNIPTGPLSTSEARIMLWLQAGQSVWLSKSCQAVVVPQSEGDMAARRFRVTQIEPDR